MSLIHSFYTFLQTSMMESQQATHTVRSHGLAVARIHMHDWLILTLLVALLIILYLIHPFHRYVGQHMMSDVKYPMKDSTIPSWAVPLYAVFLPMAVFSGFYIRRRDVYDLHHAVLGLLFSVLITGVLTQALKDAVGRPRPDFFWRCFPDGKDLYDQWGEVICHGDIKVVRDGYKSFPSGHTSWSFAGLGFLSLYLSGKIKAFDRKGHAAKLCLVFLPLLVASLAAISRVDNYRHHWEDVFAGGLIGMTVAIFCYLQFFAPPYHSEGWGPYAFFRALEESCANTSQVSGPRPTANTVGEVEVQQHERNNNSADDLESGTRS
ncbi:hypothetical protein OSB04_027346 [Centaurea solstitialis]|uniref:Phosphatidic acid phosphatase type 2/haloperoxidase domain-containing protein n=1 Tax=Centaurea solstitialis TaxID=347529 RepID=A0AA38SDP3_9ASTR|nr:hypothetical protein OSB04_027346 [Centaurea solstitialis]